MVPTAIFQVSSLIVNTKPLVISFTLKRRSALKVLVHAREGVRFRSSKLVAQPGELPPLCLQLGWILSFCSIQPLLHVRFCHQSHRLVICRRCFIYACRQNFCYSGYLSKDIERTRFSQKSWFRINKKQWIFGAPASPSLTQRSKQIPKRRWRSL